jgi:hypothetical protein
MLGKIFGSKKVVDAGIDALDALVHTDEEKSKAQRAFLKLYEPFKLAQRLIAMTTVPPYVLAWCAAFGMSCFGIDTTDQEQLLEGRMGDAVAIILAFYFGGGAAESVFKFFVKQTTKK